MPGIVDLRLRRDAQRQRVKEIVEACIEYHSRVPSAFQFPAKERVVANTLAAFPDGHDGTDASIVALVEFIENQRDFGDPCDEFGSVRNGWHIQEIAA